MGKIIEHWRIPVATLFSAVLIICAYIFARNVGSPPSVQASEETILLQAIATKDSDNDGLSDWEETLYGTDAHKSDSFNLGMTDGEAVAKGFVVPKAVANIQSATSTMATADGTLTSAFAQDFFTLYLAAKQANGGVDLTGDQTNMLVNQAMEQLSKTTLIAADSKTLADIKVFGSGPDTLRVFAIEAEKVFQKHMSTTVINEIQLLKNAVMNGDAEAFDRLASTAQIYRNYASGLMDLPVPQELVKDYLALINAMLMRSEADDNFTKVNTDPLTTMLALEQFSQTESTFWDVFSNISAIYVSSGVVLRNGTPGASFVNVIANSKETTI